MLRIRHKGGDRVTKGNYWNFATGDRVTVDSQETLPGSSSITYFKASPLVVLAAGPALGLLYAAFLPFIGLAMMLRLAVKKLFGGTADSVSTVSTFNWRPTEAYLSGKQHKNSLQKEAAETPEDSPSRDGK